MPRPEELGLDPADIVDYVVSVVSKYESDYSDRLQAINRYWDNYKGERRNKRNSYGDTPFEGVSNSFVFETPRATDSLATTRFRLLFSQDPPFETISTDGFSSESDLFALSSFYQAQMERTNYKRGVRKALTSLDLIGNAVAETPLVSVPLGFRDVTFDCTGFVPRPLSQVFFSSNSMSFDGADAKGTMDIVTDYYLHQMMQGDPEQQAWLHDGIQNAINDSQEGGIPEAVKTRMNAAGHKNFTGLKEIILYYGHLPKQKIFYPFCIGIANRKHLVRFHSQLLAQPPLLWGFTNEIEQEAWSLGVGGKGEKLQYMMNANRDRIFNVILFSLFSMMKMSRYAGIRQSDLRIKPFNIIPMDDMNGLAQLSVDVNAANYGIKMEEMLVAEFQSLTGSFKNLQAISTDVTATEAQLVMDSGMRRVAVDTEIIADVFLRDYLYYSHYQKQLFADKIEYFSGVGPGGNHQPMRLMPDQIRRALDFRIKISTDKDFRPQMTRRIIEFLQTITSIRQQLPPDLQLNLKPYIEMFTRLAGIDPRRAFSLPPIPMDQAMQNLAMFSSGTAKPPLGAMQEAMLQGIEANPARFAEQREAVLQTNQGGNGGY